MDLSVAMLPVSGRRWSRRMKLAILTVCGMTMVRSFVLGAYLGTHCGRSSRSSQPARLAVTRLQATADSDQKFSKQKFLRRPEFDPLSLQEFRREALLQYSNTNQSEPLRILIFLFLTICGLFSPTFFPSNAGPPFFVAAAAAT